MYGSEAGRPADVSSTERARPRNSNEAAVTPLSSHMTNSEEMATKLFAVLEDIHDRLGTGKGRAPEPGASAGRVDPLLVMGGNLTRRLQDCLMSAEQIHSALGG